MYDLPVSAGPGEFLDGGDYETIQVPDNELSRMASYSLRISGNSMSPKFLDGDRLISLNPDYDDIMLSRFSDVKCCGRVLGKLKRK